MRRVFAALASVLMLCLVPLIPSAAAVKAGTSCKQINLTTEISGLKYTCIKSGKKLVWSKGVKVVSAPKPTASPTPTASSFPTTSASPAAPATATPAAIKSFEELPSRTNDIQYMAWVAIQKAISLSPVQDSPIEIKVDPTTTKFSDKTSEAVRFVQNIFHGSKLPTKAWMIYYTAGDQTSRTWAASEFSKLMGSPSVSNTLSPRASSSNEAIVPLSLPNDDFTKSGGTEAHEYMHAVQFEQFVGSNKSPYVAPRWLFEGGGQFIRDFMMYGSKYEEWASKSSGTQLKIYDLKFFEDFLTYNFPIIYGPDGDPWFYTSAWPNQRVYDVGSLVYQVLIAMNGPAPVLDLFKDMSVTGNLDISFKNIYGATWSEAKPYVAKAIFGMVNR